ncbi:uncharacterized protein LOC116655258 isoform X2 [Drosophila ananassae]|uniref:uncharacterized protein LOC116655258 isoform X2 n=1 Tax=Drosophila ananassae TaxID=7217 RepID=UPI0013A5CAA6|nr:uncharacterized protein LOC116655258 isoform X2 [Drosophila ananassae]
MENLLKKRNGVVVQITKMVILLVETLPLPVPHKFKIRICLMRVDLLRIATGTAEEIRIVTIFRDRIKIIQIFCRRRKKTE